MTTLSTSSIPGTAHSRRKLALNGAALAAAAIWAAVETWALIRARALDRLRNSSR